MNESPRYDDVRQTLTVDGGEPVVESPEAGLLEELASFPGAIRRLVDDHPVERLRRPGSDGGWGVVENVSHLRDWEEIFLERARSIVERDRPALPAFDDSLWEIERRYREQDPRKVLARFSELRQSLVSFLADLPEPAWDRAGVHAVHGPITLRWLAAHLRDHDREHLLQIRDALD